MTINIKEWLQEKQEPASITIEFAGGYYRWLEDEAKHFRHAQLAFSRIASIWDLCGPIFVQEVSLEQHPDGYAFSVSFTSQNGDHIHLHEQRTRNAKRRSIWNIDVPSERYSPEPRQRGDLFAEDLRRIENRTPYPIDIDAVYAIIDGIHERLLKAYHCPVKEK